MSRPADQLRLEGTVAPGFESVRTLYEHNMRSIAERETQLCVYHNGEKVVDLWASVAGNTRFSADTLVNVFSSGKSLESIAMASLVSRGLLNYNAKITDYWPEFGENGKVDLTVAELMRHEAGLAAFDTSIPLSDLLASNIKKNAVGKVIERHRPKFRTGASGRREYHAITRGWIVNEVFRRVDPEGRTIGEFLREDISEPLGADAIIGVSESDLNRIEKVQPLGFMFQFLESLKPQFLGRKIELNIFQIIAKLVRLLPALRSRTTAGAPPPFEGMEKIVFFNKLEVAMGETPSAAANCSARGLAKIAAMMSLGGTWEEHEYINEMAWNALHADPVPADMGFTSTTFTQGGIALFTNTTASSSPLEKAISGGREGFYGWMGLGGSLFQWHPELKIGFGYVPTSLNVLDMVNERGKAYQTEVLRCVTNINIDTE